MEFLLAWFATTNHMKHSVKNNVLIMWHFFFAFQILFPDLRNFTNSCVKLFVMMLKTGLKKLSSQKPVWGNLRICRKSGSKRKNKLLPRGESSFWCTHMKQDFFSSLIYKGNEIKSVNFGNGPRHILFLQVFKCLIANLELRCFRYQKLPRI